MAVKTVVWRAERKCFAWEFSARAINTLKTFAYETQVFLVCAENIGMDEAILRMTLFIFFNGIREMLMHFLPPVILLCAVSEVNKLPLNFSAKKKQFIDCNHWLHPEIVCTIFLPFDFAQGDTPTLFSGIF